MTNLTNNKAVLSWIDEMTAITKPDKIVWITGEEEQLDALREQAVKEGILIKLNPDKLPGCYLHRTDPDDVARVEDRTFICCEKEEDAGPTNHWVEPKEMYEKMYALADGAYKGRTMYIIPYSMSIIGSPFAKYGFELTDSIYVVLNMHIMTRIGIIRPSGTEPLVRVMIEGKNQEVIQQEAKQLADLITKVML